MVKKKGEGCICFGLCKGVGDGLFLVSIGEALLIKLEEEGGGGFAHLPGAARGLEKRQGGGGQRRR